MVKAIESERAEVDVRLGGRVVTLFFGTASTRFIERRFGGKSIDKLWDQKKLEEDGVSLDMLCVLIEAGARHLKDDTITEDWIDGAIDSLPSVPARELQPGEDNLNTLTGKVIRGFIRGMPGADKRAIAAVDSAVDTAVSKAEAAKNPPMPASTGTTSSDERPAQG